MTLSTLITHVVVHGSSNCGVHAQCQSGSEWCNDAGCLSDVCKRASFAHETGSRQSKLTTSALGEFRYSEKF